LRPRLLQKLSHGLDCGFVLVSAPAGYGKSTLLSTWLSRIDLPSTNTLDEQDNDRNTFLDLPGEALRNIDLARSA
jgi:LuxR family maltose regulon positive regulatory protein